MEYDKKPFVPGALIKCTGKCYFFLVSGNDDVHPTVYPLSEKIPISSKTYGIFVDTQKYNHSFGSKVALYSIILIDSKLMIGFWRSTKEITEYWELVSTKEK